MVRDEEKQLIRQCVEALREGIPGFRSRRPQMEMIAAVANTLCSVARVPTGRFLT